MLSKTVGILSLALLVAPFLSFSSSRVLADSAPPTSAPSLDDARKATEKNLEKHLPQIHFNHIQLADCIDFLRDMTGSNIYPDWSALSAAGIRPDAPVTYSNTDAPLKQYIDDIFHNLGGTEAIDTGVVGDVIVISTAAGMKELREDIEVAAPKTDDAKLQALFDRRLPDVRFDAVGLGDAVDFLRDLTSANIYADWPALKSAGLDQTTKITLRLQDVPFRELMVLTLRSASSNSAVSVDVVGNVVVLSTVDKIKEIREAIETIPLKIDNAKLQAQLDRRLPDIKFDATNFSDIIDFLRDLTGANIFVDWRALDSVGIGKNVPITLRLRDVPLREQIIFILHEVSTPKASAAVSIDGGTINITAKAAP